MLKENIIPSPEKASDKHMVIKMVNVCCIVLHLEDLEIDAG
jgi:hypothetical protein